MKFFVSMLIMFAIVTAGISPACAFVNGGKGFIQICDSEGEAKNIEVPEEYLPFLPQDKQTKPHENAVKDCTFCMFSSHAKAFKSQRFPALITVKGDYIAVTSGTYLPQSINYTPFQPRGPPEIS